MTFVSKINHGDSLKTSSKYTNMSNSYSNSSVPTQNIILYSAENSVSSAGDVVLLEERRMKREEIAKKYGIEIQNGKMYYYLFKYPIYYYNQGDFNQEVCKNPVDGKSHTIASSGCGITCMAMLVSTFLKRNIEPTEIGEVAYSTGCFIGDGMGTHIDKIPDTLKEFGLNARLIKNDDNGRQQVKDALKSNNSLVVINVGKGDFTLGGHYMLLTDLNEENQAYVLDPNCNHIRHPERGNTNRYYDFDYLVGQAQTSNDTPFIIVSE